VGGCRTKHDSRPWQGMFRCRKNDVDFLFYEPWPRGLGTKGEFRSQKTNRGFLLKEIRRTRGGSVEKKERNGIILEKPIDSPWKSVGETSWSFNTAPWFNQHVQLTQGDFLGRIEVQVIVGERKLRSRHFLTFSKTPARERG